MHRILNSNLNVPRNWKKSHGLSEYSTSRLSFRCGTHLDVLFSLLPGKLTQFGQNCCLSFLVLFPSVQQLFFVMLGQLLVPFGINSGLFLAHLLHRLLVCLGITLDRPLPLVEQLLKPSQFLIGFLLMLLQRLALPAEMIDALLGYKCTWVGKVIC